MFSPTKLHVLKSTLQSIRNSAVTVWLCNCRYRVIPSHMLISKLADGTLVWRAPPQQNGRNSGGLGVTRHCRDWRPFRFSNHRSKPFFDKLRFRRLRVASKRTCDSVSARYNHQTSRLRISKYMHTSPLAHTLLLRTGHLTVFPSPSHVVYLWIARSWEAARNTNTSRSHVSHAIGKDVEFIQQPQFEPGLPGIEGH
jgi:hypothetical protein